MLTQVGETLIAAFVNYLPSGDTKMRSDARNNVRSYFAKPRKVERVSDSKGGRSSRNAEPENAGATSFLHLYVLTQHIRD